MARKMKDSGIEWIGEIPEGWEVSKLKYLGRYVNGYPFKPDDWGNKGKPIIRIQDLTGSNDSPNYYDGDIDAKYHIKNGDILVSWAATLDAFIWNKGDGLLNQHIFKAIPQEEKITSYFFFWMIKEAMQNMNNDNKHGIFMQHVTLDVFNNFSVPLPPLSEQKRIATYLFQKISEADIMLDDTLSSITGYKKLKQAVITQAVIKGVRGEREMKDSKVDYIGQIPDEWVLCKLRNIGDAQNGISKASEFFGKGTPFVSYSDVYKNYSLPFSVSGLVESTPEEQERYSVKEGDIFFTRTSETIEEVGFSCVCEKDIPNATFAGFLIRVRPFSDKLHTPYAKYYFRSSHLRFYLVKEMNLVTRASLGQSLLKSMPVLLPPLEEQKEIADYLDAKCAEIDRLIAKKEQLVKELESYKKSLIYEVVTGKREV